jgi:uncharacterized repeat protein (TIGR03803 family)
MNPLIRSSLYLRRIVVVLATLFVTVMSAHAQTLTVLHSFTSRPDGLTPVGGVIMDQAGNLYGTTAQGGTGTQGTVFKIDTSGNETVLHSFVGRPDGLDPEAGLVIDQFNNLYGTTELGGSEGKGTIFKVDSSGNETVLHSFTCCPPLGRNPVAGLILDGAGNLYGTAQNGGDLAQDGTVFKLSPSGTLTVLHEFNARKLVPSLSPNVLDGDGRNPRGTLLLDAASGNLYGTTYQGGGQDRGTVFRIDAAGGYLQLYSFGSADGKWPTAGVIRDQAGNLYGTCSNGGQFNGGTVFKVDMSGNQTVLHNFGAPGDGQWPLGGLAMDVNGNLYGTTSSGSVNAPLAGTVFKIDNFGNYSVLHGFNGSSDGASPAAGVIVGADGNLYGTTSEGGPGNGFFGTGGTVFKLTLP